MNPNAPSEVDLPKNRILATPPTLVLLIGDAMIAWTSFLLGAVYAFGRDSYIEQLHYHNGFYRIFGSTVLVLVCSYEFDLYNATSLKYNGWFFRLLLVLGLVTLILAGVEWLWPGFPSLASVIILFVALIGWRCAFTWLAKRRR